MTKGLFCEPFPVMESPQMYPLPSASNNARIPAVLILQDIFPPLELRSSDHSPSQAHDFKLKRSRSSAPSMALVARLRRGWPARAGKDTDLAFESASAKE